MKNVIILLFSMLLIVMSCKPIARLLKDPKTPHEAYAEKLDDSGIKKTLKGRQWLEASEKALIETQNINLPYKQTGYFPFGKPRSLGLKFSARSGERISFTVQRRKYSGSLYIDLYQENEGSALHLFAADTTTTEFNFDIPTTGNYILRIQPEIDQQAQYDLTLLSGPSLLFPVAGKANVGSFWGVDRDGGKRKHEGIDIFAAKKTPVLASSDGIITAVREGGLGGKTVWLRPAGKDYTLYYAHLDKQLVENGEVIKKGDTIGLVGNTGNARNTPSHLHFGVYTATGPVDPLPYIDKKVKTLPAVPSKNLTRSLKLVKPRKINTEETVSVNTLLIPIAINADGYIAELPDGKMILAPFTYVKTVSN